MFLHICTVDLGSQNSALLVDKVKNVKFDHDFATFFGDFDDFHDRVLNEKKTIFECCKKF